MSFAFAGIGDFVTTSANEAQPQFLRLDLTKSAPILPLFTIEARIEANWQQIFHQGEQDGEKSWQDLSALLLDEETSAEACQVMLARKDYLEHLKICLCKKSKDDSLPQSGTSSLENMKKLSITNEEVVVSTDLIAQRAAFMLVVLALHESKQERPTRGDLALLELSYFMNTECARTSSLIKYLASQSLRSQYFVKMLSCVPSFEIPPMVETLGAGKHGVVQALNETQVMKRFSVEAQSLMPNRIERIFSEVECLSILNNAQENLTRSYFVKMIDFGRMKNSGDIYLLLERAACTMKSWRQGIGAKLGREEFLECLRKYLEIVEAVRFMSEQCVVHYDLHLENVLVSNEGVPILCDFGEAHHYQPESHTSSFQFESRGTESIMAPEMLTVCNAAQARERGVVDRRRTYQWGTSLPADVWSLTCLFYELITLELLYEEAATDWPTFFSRLTSSNADLPLISNGQKERFLEKITTDFKTQAAALFDEIFTYGLVRDPQLRPTAAAFEKYVREKLSNLK